MPTGILALQGCIDPHLRLLKRIGEDGVPVRTSEDLSKIDRIILPGGESSTMIRLLKANNMWESLLDFVKTSPSWGICAGAILLAKEVINPAQDSLGVVSVRAVRNFYGSQLDSFKTRLDIHELGLSLNVDFIRAPKFELLRSNVRVLAEHNNLPVLVQEGQALVSSFHVELGESPELHRFFVGIDNRKSTLANSKLLTLDESPVEIR